MRSDEMQVEIKKEIMAILREKFNICLDESQYSESLFAPSIGLAARDFAELVFSIEHGLQIIFSEDELLDVNITSISGLAECCYNEVLKNQSIFTLQV